MSTKNIAVMAMLLAARVILNLPALTIYVTPQFKLITFAYAADALCAMTFGPIAAIAFAFAGDTLGYMVNPAGAYFPGFALSEMATCLIFALCFYKKPVTWPRAALAWALNLAAVVLGLNSLWLITVYGMNAGQTFALVRVVSNIAQSPLHVAVLYFVLTRFRALMKRIR